MANKKISELETATSPLTGTEYVLGIQNGVSVKLPVLPSGKVSGAIEIAPITVINTNEILYLSSSYLGVIPSNSYIGSGTTITVFEGNVQLTYDGVGTSAGTWHATAIPTNVTVGSASSVDGKLIVGNLSEISNSIDNSLIIYNITGKRLDGTDFAETTKQIISKVKAGVSGPIGDPGPPGPVGSSLTFIQIDSPVIVKDAVDAETYGTYSTIVIQGKKSDTTTVNYGWITVTPNGSTESGTAINTAITPYSYTLTNNSGVSSVIVRMYNQSAVSGATLLDTQHLNVVYRGLTGQAYQVSIESSNGTEFRVGENTSTLLKARLFLNGVEITDSTPASWFSWRRASIVNDSPPNDDASWNSLYTTGYKQVLIYVDTVDSKATFFCDIISP